MKTMLITLIAMDDDEAVAECQAEIDLVTFELSDVADDNFTTATASTYEGFAMTIEGKIYPISVDYLRTGNEFMLMDADGTDAITKYANDNPSQVDGEDAFDDTDFDEDDTDFEGATY